MIRLVTYVALALFSLYPLTVRADDSSYGIALHGTLKYPPHFTHFDYVNPDAPKGGELRLGSLGTYDSVNPFILKGVPADGANMVFETLMTHSLDEPLSQYGWIAQSVTVAPDRSWVSYTLRPEAKFHDGSPITAEDVIFSYEILRDKGYPSYRSYYKDVEKVEKLGPHEVKFTFKDTKNVELPIIMGELPIFSKKDWQGKDFSATTLDPILGSGPYEIDHVEQGRSITYKRVKDWWAKDLPVNLGRFNYDTIRFDYYRDPAVELEGLLSGQYDIRWENSAKNWATAYDTPAVKEGLIQRIMQKNELPQGMQGFVFNTRRDFFKDRRVREAIGYALDFEWSVKTVAYNAYQRMHSYFENSELAAKGLPTGRELALLEPYRGQVPDEVFTKEFMTPVTDGSGDNRENLHKAAELLHEAGWNLKDGKLVDAQGQPLKFEILDSSNMFERWVGPFALNLKRLGIDASYRIVDPAQYQNRLNDFNFDMTTTTFPASLSPGNEERSFWSSQSAAIKGSNNIAGVHDPVVDNLLDKLVHAESREDLVATTRALDRVLLWQYYVVPHWYIDSFRLAYWDIFGRPSITPPYGMDYMDAWWIDPVKAQKINAQRQRNR